MKIAVIGSGIAGLAATWYLSKHHQVTLCERGPGIGMDAHSVELDAGQGVISINAPMRVFFEAYYPTLSELYREIGAAYEPIRYSGSFSLRGGRAYFQYRNFWLGKSTLPFLTGRSTRLPAAWRLGLELVRLIRHVRKLDSLPDAVTIEEFLNQHGYTDLGDSFLYPTFAGICTCSYDQVKAYPAAIILDYLGRDLTWSRVNRLTHGVRDVTRRLSDAAANVRCNIHLKAITPNSEGVLITDGNGYQEQFDHVVVATQANQALQLLPDSMRNERCALSEFRYQQSRLVVHGDPRLAPAEKRDWAPVNFVLNHQHDMPMASIWMNSIYPELKNQRPVFETWNPFDDVEIEHTLIDTKVDRPLVTQESMAALQQLHQLQQQQDRKVSFCGSYADRGIPLLESAVSSAKTIAERLAPGHDTLYSAAAP